MRQQWQRVFLRRLRDFLDRGDHRHRHHLGTLLRFVSRRLLQRLLWEQYAGLRQQLLLLTYRNKCPALYKAGHLIVSKKWLRPLFRVFVRVWRRAAAPIFSLLRQVVYARAKNVCLRGHPALERRKNRRTGRRFLQID